MEILADNALMLQVKNGELDKMALLFKRYHRQLFGFLFNMTGQREASEDMVQNVFYRMLRSRHTFTGNGEFKTWMYHLARNVLKDHFRKNKKNSGHYDVTDFAERIAGGTLADEAIEKNQEWSILQQALTHLNEENREALVLSRFQNMKYHEIAAIMNITEGAVKLRIFRAMTQLKNMYSKSLSNEM